MTLHFVIDFKNPFRIHCETVRPAELGAINLKLDAIMSKQVETLTAIRDGLNKVGTELTGKIDELIAAQGTELNPDAQAIADEIKTKLAALDAVVPDA